MEILETPPLDGGDSDAYKTLVREKLRPLRVQALSLVTTSLHRYYHKQSVDLATWWNESNRTALYNPDTAEKTADSWHVRSGAMPAVPSDYASPTSSTPLMYAVAALSDDAKVKKTVTPRIGHSQLKSVNEIRANVVWRFLEDRGYINEDHTLSQWVSHIYLNVGCSQAQADITGWVH